MKKVVIFITFMASALLSQAKVWRVNNNAGVTADFNTFYGAVLSNSVLSGDTLYMEPSYLDYVTNSVVVNKKLIVIGPGYFLDSTQVNFPANAGLQATKADARIQNFYISNLGNGSRFLGLQFTSFVYMQGCSKISFEKVCFQNMVYFYTGPIDSISFRKCFFNTLSAEVTAAAGVATTNMVFENNIFYNGGYVYLPQLTGSGNIFRNNSVNSLSTSATWGLANMYVANNIFGTTNDITFTNCTIKNNLFSSAQTLPGTAINNLISQATASLYVGGTGSLDSRMILKTGSAAIGFGLTVGSVTSPDAGAFGATDPYKLSGIPNIPSIYALSVPLSIPSGAATMNISFSTRNNN